MSEERKKVLEMLAAGKISPEDAERLLDRLVRTGPNPEADHEPEVMEGPVAVAVAPRAKLKYLRILVEGLDGENVNIRVPLALIRTGLKLGAMLPNDAREALDEHGVDLSQLSELHGEELIEALRELRIDVDGDDGEKVRIFCE
jgi:hypothetical protein